MEKNAFLRIFGGSNSMKVFDYLLDLDMDFNIGDIMDGTELSRKTVEKILGSFLENDLIKQSRLIGKTKMYKLNFDNPIVKKLRDINAHVIQQQETRAEALITA